MRVGAFTDELIRAAVREARFADPAATDLLTTILIERRDAIVRAYLPKITPLVRFSVNDLGANKGKKVRGTTVAELGNRNQPLDIVLYEKGGDKFLLISNTARGVMKVSTKDIGRKEGIEAPVGGGGTAGQTDETIKDLEGTVQLDRLDDTQAVVVIKSGDSLALKTVALP